MQVLPASQHGDLPGGDSTEQRQVTRGPGHRNLVPHSKIGHHVISYIVTSSLSAHSLHCNVIIMCTLHLASSLCAQSLHRDVIIMCALFSRIQVE